MKESLAVEPHSTLGTDVSEERIAFIFRIFTVVKTSNL
jgi:hypothetical protein